jgi:hypothetical protein
LELLNGDGYIDSIVRWKRFLLEFDCHSLNLISAEC